MRHDTASFVAVSPAWILLSPLRSLTFDPRGAKTRNALRVLPERYTTQLQRKTGTMDLLFKYDPQNLLYIPAIATARDTSQCVSSGPQALGSNHNVHFIGIVGYVLTGRTST